MSIKLIVLNGPKRTGKDTAYKALVEMEHALHPEIYMDTWRFSYADIIRRATHEALGIQLIAEDYSYITDTYDSIEIKDTPHDDFVGLTPRQAYIEVGQSMRKIFGKDIFNRAIVRQINKVDEPDNEQCNVLAVVTDCGFPSCSDSLLCSGNTFKWCSHITFL